MTDAYQFLLQPIGFHPETGKLLSSVRTLNGQNAWATWEGMADLTEAQRQAVVFAVQCVPGMAHCEWASSDQLGDHLTLKRQSHPMSWGAIAQSVCDAVAASLGVPMVLVYSRSGR